MALHVIFIDKDGQQLSDVTSNFTSVTIPQNAFIMRIADDSKSYSNSTLTKLFEIDNTFYSKVLEYTLKGDYPFIDVSVSDFGGFTAIFNQLSAQFIGNNPPADIYDFSGYGGSGSGGSIDFSTIVTALNSIASALSALTNLSNLSNLTQLANIITAISNKDNQSDIVSILEEVFIDKISSTNRQSTLKRNSSSNNNNYLTIYSLLLRIFQALSTSNFLPYESYQPQNRLLANLACLSTASSNDYNAYRNNSNLKNIDSRLQNIETKLEQNLPFVTNVYPLVETNVDFPYEVKILNKDNCSDNKKNDI